MKFRIENCFLLKTQSKYFKAEQVTNAMPIRKKRQNAASNQINKTTVANNNGAQSTLSPYHLTPKHNHEESECIAKTWHDGSYLFILYTEPVDNKNYSLSISLSITHKNGYLSANDWPFLPVHI